MDGTFPWLTVLTTKSVVNFHHPVTAHSGQTAKTSGNLIIATCFNQFSFYGFTPTIYIEPFLFAVLPQLLTQSKNSKIFITPSFVYI